MTSISTLRQLPANHPASRILGHWKWTYIGYGIVHYVLVILGIISGAAVAADAAATTFLPAAIAAALGIIASAAVAITNALDTGGKHKRFNRAWVILNAAVMKYETDNSYDIKEVTNAYLTGENVLLEKTEVVKNSNPP